MALAAKPARKKKTSAKLDSGHACLHLDADARKDARLRLLSVRGHVEGILRMLEDDSVYCVDVLKQIKAVDGALGKVGNLILKAHLHDHVITAAKRGDEEAIIAELMEVLKYR